MSKLTLLSDSDEILPLARRLRDGIARETSLSTLIEKLASWGARLLASRACNVPGAAYLSMWLRRENLQRLLEADFGCAVSGMLGIPSAFPKEPMGNSSFIKPVGIVGHWTAGNVDLQAVLSGVCGLLGGNANLIRVPSDQRAHIEPLLACLAEDDSEGALSSRLAFISFPSDRVDLHEAMARHVDGAMIWGGDEAVRAVRALPFPSWARIAVFGPRYSLALMDALTWSNPATRKTWCDRLARDVWLYEQRACSSPQAIVLERGNEDPREFVRDLADSFRAQNKRVPRRLMEPADALTVLKARADWLLQAQDHTAQMSFAPDWTVLVGEGSALPQAAQHRTLVVTIVDRLEEFVASLDGVTQTMGVAVADAGREAALAQQAALRGVDRIVPIGQMHFFNSPWDGQMLVKGMTRTISYARSRHQEEA